ncbi:MAG: hypothetical protein AAF658_06455, partial [Myxococcota bacterium]
MTFLVLGLAWCTLAGKSAPTRRESRTLAVKNAIRAGLTIDARVRLTAGKESNAGLSADALRDAARKQEEPIVECLLQQTRRLGAVSGILELRLLIDPVGGVESAQILGECPPQLRECLEGSIEMMDFPSSPNMSSTRATLR